MRYRCDTCRWFDDEHQRLESAPDGYGYCRKHRPVVYRFEDQHWGGWPLVDAADFCGEFRQREDE